MIILSKQFPHEEQQFEIFIKYDEVAKKPVEVKNISLQTNGRWYPVGNIMTKLFAESVWKLVMETDWQQVHEDSKKKPTISDLIHPIMEASLHPFLVTGGEVKEIYN